ncbi:MAG: hypothetical protein RLY16_2890 [Bacteroidota bacterium]|jgi:hypothetical protein
MKKHVIVLALLIFNGFLSLQAQLPIEKKQIAAKRIQENIKVDGKLTEPIWQGAPVANQFVSLRPVPFKPENPDNATEVFFLYNDEGIYIGGNLYEKTKDSIASELIGRDGFGNNDFIGIIFDTYVDKLNAFEYFVTPLGEQMDARFSPNMNGNNEDFNWNGVWQSASVIHDKGWSFEMFIPYSAIRFGKKQVQDWGLNIVRRRQKSGEQLFWQSIDPNVNGFLTQEGFLKGLENIKPPLRLQFSPYFSVYANHNPNPEAGANKVTTLVNGGMDVKYGLNQAFTLDMTLIPDFGQVVTDNRVLNLSPFEVRFNENRQFFTEGTELFNKGDLFYSRRIGAEPIHYWDAYGQTNGDESVIKNPSQSKLINATKISGRTQSGLGIGILNAVTRSQFATIENSSKQQRQFETDPLTNYNVLVLNQSLKNNSSVSFVNTNVWRSGPDYDANVSALLFDLNDKSNTWNVGGGVNMSALMNKNGKTVLGYAHSIYFGKTSGRFNFNVWQDLSNDKYDKSDMGYFTNNNTMDQGVWMGYNWTKPRGFYNQLRINFNGWYSRLVSPLDILLKKDRMFQGAGANINLNAQTKRLWWIGANINMGAAYNDFYEARVPGRVFANTGRVGAMFWWNSNEAKKFSWGGQWGIGTGGVFKRVSFDPMLFGKIRFNSKFSIDHNVTLSIVNDQPGWAATIPYMQGDPWKDTIIFSRRNVRTVENILNIKYSFTNRMGITFRARHYWSKVDPQQFYELKLNGKLVKPENPFTGNVKQNYNFFSVDMVYTWQFAQGSFLNLVWKDMAETFNREFERNYMSNLSKTLSGSQTNSVSLRVIYFIDYLQAKKHLHKKPLNS